MCGLDIFLTNKNRNAITRATNSPRVSLEFQLPFENLLSADMQRIFFILCCLKAVSVEYKYKHFTFFQLAMHISDVRPPIFSLLFYSLRKPPLEESVILEGIQPQNSR